MQIISHRGYWKDFATESNKKIAFERSFNMGIGTETDLRDVKGTIVISHDMPRGTEMTFEELLQIMSGRNLPLALNIKADGLGTEIERLLMKYEHTNYFTFDMSVPDLVYQTEKTNLNVYTGCSDMNPYSPMNKKVKGIWLDAFYEVWYSEKQIIDFLNTGKEVCIVSEDLHGRVNDKQWCMLNRYEFLDNDRIMLCTNEPDKAAMYFGSRDLQAYV